MYIRGCIFSTQLYNTKESATEAPRQSSGHSHQSAFQKIDPCISVHYFFLPHLKADALHLDIVSLQSDCMSLPKGSRSPYLNDDLFHFGRISGSPSFLASASRHPFSTCLP